MQNSFVSKGGMFDLAGFDIAGSAPVIEVNRRLLEASRKAGVKVVYLMMAFKPDSATPAIRRHRPITRSSRSA